VERHRRRTHIQNVDHQIERTAAFLVDTKRTTVARCHRHRTTQRTCEAGYRDPRYRMRPSSLVVQERLCHHDQSPSKCLTEPMLWLSRWNGWPGKQIDFQARDCDCSNNPLVDQRQVSQVTSTIQTSLRLVYSF
jgi:hypothetical protein